MHKLMKIIVFFTLFIIVFIYTVKSIFDLKVTWKQYNQLKPQYQSVLEQNNNLTTQLQVMLNKVVGIREQTLNKDILEERAKLMLDYKKPYEIVIAE